MRRRFIAGLVLAAGLVADLAAGSAGAQTFPSKPITVVVPFTAGGPTDTLARILAERMGRTLGQTVVVENTTGAAGTLGVARVVRAAPDGYTIGIGHWSTHVVNPAIYPLKFDILDDLEPLADIATNPQLLVTRKDLPANDLKGLIEIVKKDPGKYNYATVGIGSTQHLIAELFRQRAGLQAQAVSFRTTGEVVTALLRKDVAYAVDLAHAVRGQVASGELKLIAVTTGKRFPSLPNVPTMVESGMPGFEINGWYGMVYPAGVPNDIIVKTHKTLSDVVSRDAVKKQLENIGAEASLSSPEAFGKLIAEEVTRWREVAKAAGLEAQ